MKALFTIVVGILISFSSLGQLKFNIKWGSLNKNKGYDNFQIFKTPKGFASLRYVDEGEFLLEEFDKHANKVGEQEIELDSEKSFRRKTTFVEAIEYNAKWYIVFTHYDKNEDLQNLYIQEFGVQGMKNRTKITSFNAETRRKQQDITFNVIDSTRIVVRAQTPPRNSKDPVDGKILLLDNNFKLLSEKGYETSFKGNYFSFYKSPQFDASGNMVLIANVKQDKEEKKKTKLELLSFDFKTGKFSALNTDIKDNGIYDMNFLYKKDSKQVVLVGLISKENSSRRANESRFSGFIHRTYDLGQGGAIIKDKISFLKQDEIAKLIGEKAASKEKEVPSIEIRNIYYYEDGSSTLLAEVHFVITSTYTGANGMTRTMTEYFYNDILSVGFKPDGSYDSFSVIKKNQNSTGNLSLFSYLSYNHKSKIVVVFNDDEDNCEAGINRQQISNPDEFNGEKNCVVVIGKFDDKGKLKASCEGKQIVEDEQIYIRTSFNYQIDENSYLLFGSTRRSKVFSFGILTIK